MVKIRCPICGKLRSKFRFVNYHIQYYPEKIIKACQYCNHSEYLLRKGRLSDFSKGGWNRAFKVWKFQKKHSNIRYD